MVAQPRVIVATTSLEVASTIETQITEMCGELGLTLEVGPHPGQKTFDNSEHLFSELSQRSPAEMLDALIVLHVSLELEECFESKVSKGNSSWHVSSASKPGVAMELVLRFPQLFPVFLSPLVPPSDGGNGSAEWTEFRGWLDGWLEDLQKDMGGAAEAPALPSWERVHFVSIADEFKGLRVALERFANGFRAIFDPTGLRSLLRNRFLAQVFGALSRESNGRTGWDNTKRARGQLNQRFLKLAVIFEEEPDLTLLSGYAAYKFGYRSWMISSYSEFTNSEPPDWGRANNLLLIRDIDLRLPDIPPSANPKSSIRLELRNIYSERWASRLAQTKHYSVRVVSQDAGVITAAELKPTEHSGSCELIARLRSRAGENGDALAEADSATPTDDVLNKLALRLGQTCECSGEYKFIGLSKPLSSIYAVTELFLDETSQPRSLIGTLTQVESMNGHASHGAPYMNLRIATHLIQQAKQCRESRETRHLLVGALLAQEAYSLLLGMSRSTALSALHEMHLAEATVESSSIGITYSVSITERRDDLTLSVNNISPEDAGFNFLAKLWADLRLVYRDGEQFEASERANIESLVNGHWFSPSRRRRKQRPRLRQIVQCIKRAILKPLHSFLSLLAFWLAWSFILTVLYCYCQSRWRWSPNAAGVLNFFDVYVRVIVAISRVEGIYEEGLNEVGSNGGLYLLKRATDVLCAITSVLSIGLIVSVIFRKSTRG